MATVRAKATLEGDHGIESEILDQTALRTRAPYLSHDLIGGAFYPGEGKANPLLATKAFANAAVRQGARIQTQTNVTGLSKGKQFIVETDQGSFEAPKVVCAAGAEAGAIAAMAGLELPIRGYPIPG